MNCAHVMLVSALLCGLAISLGQAQAEPGTPRTASLRMPLDPSEPMNIEASNNLVPVVKVWQAVPVDLRGISVVELHNNDNGVRAIRFEKLLRASQEYGIPVIPEVVRSGATNSTISLAWVESMLKRHPIMVGVEFGCDVPGQLDTRMMREYLEVCGQNGAYFLYNMSVKAQSFPEDFDAMLADEDLVAAMRKYHRNIIVQYYAGGFDVTVTEAQKAESLAKLRKMLADGLIGRIGYVYETVGAADIRREHANGCTAFGVMPERRPADYWTALRQIAPAKEAEPAPLRWSVDPSRPMHMQGSTVLRDLVAAWHEVPEDLRPISFVELANYDNAAEAEAFEDCFAECQANGIPVSAELVRYGAQNASVNDIWLGSMLRKYPTIAGIVFDVLAPEELDTGLMRAYLEVCGQNGVYFFFNVENKSMTLPEHLDTILADRDLVAAMKRYHRNIAVNYYAGGMRGEPTAAQKAENLETVQKMLADGLIGRIAYFYSTIRGSDVDRERANGCSIFGGNEPQMARDTDYWESLRKVIAGR